MEEEDEHVCLKVSHIEDDCEVTKLSYKQLFKLNAKLIKEHDKIEKGNVDLKDYIKFLENSNETLKYEITNIRNQVGTCETYDSMKKEVKDLHKTLIKFTKGKEKLDLILSNQRPPLNKT